MNSAIARRRRGLTGIAVIALLLASGCTSPGSSEGSCAALVRFHHRTYSGMGNVDFTAGKRLGTGIVPRCNDTGGKGKHSEPTEPIPTVFAVKGLDPEVAVAAGGSRGDAQFYALKHGKKTPDAVRKYMRSHH